MRRERMETEGIETDSLIKKSVSGKSVINDVQIDINHEESWMI